jgi:titin
VTVLTNRSGFPQGSGSTTGTSITGAALTPTFGTPNPTANGFTVQISNYNGSYNWGGTATASGSVSISGTGLVTVTNVAPGTSSTVTVNTTRAG